MGFLSNLIGALTGGSKGGTNDPLVSAVVGFINQNGGLQGLLGKFQQQGLGSAFQSWVGTGDNQPVDGEQVRQAFGAEQIDGLAAKFGVPSGQASALLAQHLPKIIDKLTPKGQIDPSANVQKGVADLLPSLLQGGLGSLFGDKR